jgi:septum formation protein
MEIFKKHQIILGSQSPRRSQLLREAGFEFSVRVLEIDEDFDPDMPANQVAEYLAIEKSKMHLSHLKPGDIVITADSVVALDEKIYNKPGSYDEAVEFLTKLSGRTHQVYTGVCMLSTEKCISFTDRADVSFSYLTLEEIEYYIKRCLPFDKAGAYGIQEWIGYTKVEKIHGTFATIMGLPVHLVYQRLLEWDDSAYSLDNFETIA